MEKVRLPEGVYQKEHQHASGSAGACGFLGEQDVSDFQELYARIYDIGLPRDRARTMLIHFLLLLKAASSNRPR